MKHHTWRRGLFYTILLLFTFSIVLNIFLYSQVRQYSIWLHIVELDPLGLSYFDDSPIEKPAEGSTTVVFYGDSRAAQWPSPALDGFWFVNRGIGSQTTAQVTSRFAEHIAPLQPGVVVLQVGINDLKTVTLFPERKMEIISNCKENIRRIIDASLRSDSMVVVSTIFPIGKAPRDHTQVWSSDIDEAIVDVNRYIRSLATDQVLVFDAARLLSDKNGKLKQEYSSDGLHLNEAGYAILNSELVKLLERNQEESQ
jgi:lysophospholipase L1-like esterase